MEDERARDIRVPLVFFLFSIFLLAGGVFLILYVFVPDSSRPWYPIAAFVLIGAPWVFWLMTYIYTCIKACCKRNRLEDRQLSQRSSPSIPRSTTGASAKMASQKSNAEGRSSASSSECEKPLALSVAS